MVQIALTIEGETSEVVAAVRQIASGSSAVIGSGDILSLAPAMAITSAAPGAARNAVDRQASSSVSDSVPEDRLPVATPTPDHRAGIPDGRWSIENVRIFWRYLSDDARTIYRSVAHSPGYTRRRQLLLDEMQLAVRQLSGRLASQGHAVRRIRREQNINLPAPLRLDNQSGEYKMHPDVGDVIVRLDF